MNARDQIKPKSIRLSILQALSDGAITTIDDLQIKMDEPRKKVATNVYPAAIEGLIKRMRDDVTGGPAYQITAQGREYLAKYVSGKEVEPSLPEVPVCAESQTAVITPGVKADVSQRESIDAAHKKAVMAWEISMMAAIGEDGISDVVKAIEKIKQERDGLRKELGDAKASLELSRLARKTTEPVFYALQRPAKPLVRFTKLNSAETRAMAFARGGKRAQVFALTLVGTAVPGSEWRKA